MAYYYYDVRETNTKHSMNFYLRLWPQSTKRRKVHQVNAKHIIATFTARM